MISALRRAKRIARALYISRAIVQNPVSAAWFFARTAPPECSASFRFRPIQAYRECASQDVTLGSTSHAPVSTRSSGPTKQLKFKTRNKDWTGVREVLLEREYQDVLWELQYAQTPVVLDLGANIGTFAIFVLANFPAARVLSLEPAADTYAMLESNRAMNRRFDWQCVHGALWAEAGTLSLQHSKASTGNRVTSEGGDENIPAITLPEVINQVGGWVDLAKMDIEGAEDGVLQVAADSLAAIASLAIEIHNDRINERQVAKVLYGHYKFCYLISGRASQKPLVLATNRARSLPVYECP